MGKTYHKEPRKQAAPHGSEDSHHIIQKRKHSNGHKTFKEMDRCLKTKDLSRLDELADDLAL